MDLLERAIILSTRAHAGQRDKAGEPYILHPLRIMGRFRREDERLAAVLHDVVEDTELTLDDLRAEGFPEAVVEAVDALTRREGESYLDFVRRAARNPVARRVKVADIRDNMDLGRIAQPTDRDRRRIERYREALAVLEAVAPED